MSVFGDGISALELLGKTVKEINLAFGFKVEQTDDESSDNDGNAQSTEDTGVNAHLAIINLDEEVAPLVIGVRNIELSIPTGKAGTDWDGIDERSVTEKNCWLRIPSYLKEKNKVEIEFKILNSGEKDTWMSFYNLKTRRTIKVFFENTENGWKYKVGRFNLFKEAKN
ncbi:hypothetical protein [Lactobacillus gallinarum]|uniref:hypothetical protein n=1 Tax=Lactobacillus gallinarum TaxID=52242 RepID=UPI0025A4A79D|nr:hypothetical protein [Lactobacillus gallinarum]MDM8282900.1 hypothetical protein [Lactobacillus gallinarum]